MTERRWLTLILILFLLLGTVYAVVTPAFEASDELWHYPMIRHLADGNPLPVQVFDPALAGPWKQEASQPPLYYYLGAALTFWIETSDMEEVLRENPHVDNGLITEDGNINLVVHDPAANPWQGTLLAVRVVRLASVLMGAVTVYLTYRIAGAALPGRPEIALGAAAVNAFMPMFLFISGAVNNDNLAIMLSSLALFQMIALVTAGLQQDSEEQGKLTGRQIAAWLMLGVVVGLALLTKEGTLGLIPMAWGTCFVVSWLERPSSSQKSPSLSATLRWLLGIFLQSLLYFALVLLPALLIAGWWYWRNVELYGDWLGWNAFIAVLGQRAHPASVLQLWGERHGFLMAYWGLFGGVNVPMSSWVYTVLNTLLVIAVIGFAVVLLRALRTWFPSTRGDWRSLRGIVDNLLGFVANHFALIAALLFSAAVVFGLIRWATTTWSSQGRLVFTAISALTTLFMVGLAGWMPRPAARWTTGIVGLFFLLLATAAPFLWIRPAYQSDRYRLAEGVKLQGTEAIFGDQMRLRSAAIETAEPGTAVEPGSAFWVHLDWEVLAPTTRDWSVFVHAVDPVLGRPIAQRDMYLGQGLILTSWLEPGQRLNNSYYVQLPQTAVAPAELQIVTGLYDVATGERLPASSGSDLVELGTVSLETGGEEFPNQTSVNFEDKFELVGFLVEPRSILAGDTIDLTLYLRPLTEIDRDYTVFAQVVDEDTTRWASSDVAPPEGTSRWAVDETQALPLSLDLAPDTPADVFPLIVGIYTQDGEGNFNRLQIKTPDGRLTDDFLELARIRVE